uniref:Glycosyltransferase family 92 protein n=1 Tax=Oreochromis aureus TaxID=47969 RepID=A0A668SA87_OREAU
MVSSCNFFDVKTSINIVLLLASFLCQVRVIAVVLRRENVAYRCLFRCQEKQLLSNGSASIHRDHFGFAYGTADIMCPLPSGCETPSSIAVTSAAANTTEFLEVKNQQEKTESFPYNFTVCISTMFDFTNVLQLVQSLEMLQLLGVNRVVVYKTSCSPETQRILDYYTHKGLVEVIPWSLSRYVNVSRSWLPSHGPGELHYFGQIPALNDCLYRYMYQSRYVALHDIDELILPQNKYGANKCYRFENDVFPINFTFSPPASQSLPPQADWKNVPGVNILAHLYKEPVFIETRMNFKIIVNPRVVFSTSVHGVLKSHCFYVSAFPLCRSPRQIHLTKEKLIYDGRLLNYSTHFTPAVNKVLRDTGLLPSTNSL